MAARYPWYLLADSEEGKAKEADLTLRPPSDAQVHHDIRQGFVYERVPHITLKSIANNARIDYIWERWQAELEPLRRELNHLRERHYADDAAGYTREETQIAPEPSDADSRKTSGLAQQNSGARLYPRNPARRPRRSVG